MHRVEEVVAAGASREALVLATRCAGDRHHAVVSHLDGLDLALLDALGEIVQRDWLDVGSPTLLHDREEERDDRDQDDQVDKAISEPLRIHAWWDPPGCSHYSCGTSLSRVFRLFGRRALPYSRNKIVSEPIHSSTPCGK